MMRLTDATRREQRLVLRAQSGDRLALDELLSATQLWLREYLRRLLGDMHAADDALQSALILVVRKLGFLQEPRAFRAWVYRLATREAWKHFRRDRRWLRGDDFDTSMAELQAPEESTSSGVELSPGILEQISCLGPNTRAVVVLHYVEGLTLRHVADVLGLNLGTVKSRLAYGLEKLRQAAIERDP